MDAGTPRRRDRPGPLPPLPPLRFDRREVGGALGDVGVLFPLAVALIALNGLNATAVFLVAGLLYVAAGLYFRVPVPVQPLKAASALALALGLGPGVIGAAGLLMGTLLLALAATGLAGRLSALFPRPLVRGVQLGIGLLLVQAAWNLATGPSDLHRAVGPAAALVTLLVLARFAPGRRVPVSLGVLAAGAALGWALSGGDAAVPLGAGGAGAAGWAGEAGAAGVARGLRLTLPSRADLVTAFFALVVPQLPLTLANAVVATEDAARGYFGLAARRVTARALAASLGLANALAGLVQGMPVCHGAGGLTAHYRFGARTGGAAVLMGLVCLALAALPGRAGTALAAAIPPPVLAGFLAFVGLEHAALAADLRDRRERLVALGTGAAALVTASMAWGLLAGFLLQVGLFGGWKAAPKGAGEEAAGEPAEEPAGVLAEEPAGEPMGGSCRAVC